MCIQVDEKLDVFSDFEKGATFALVREGHKAGEPVKPGPSSYFMQLGSSARYLLVGEGKPRAKQAAPEIGGAFAGIKIINDESMPEETSSCSCLWGVPCVSEYNCKDWANRAEVARRNSKKSSDASN